MKLRSVKGFTGALIIYLCTPASAVAAIYKCVDGQGNTAYQVEPCNDLQKSTEVEIEKFVKPTPVPAKQESAAEENPKAFGSAREADQTREAQRIAACRKLEKRYGADISRAKKTDAARKKAQEEYAKKSRQRDRRVLNIYNKDKRRYRKELARNRQADSIYRRGLKASYQVDMVKSRYQSDKKRLGCDSVFLY